MMTRRPSNLTLCLAPLLALCAAGCGAQPFDDRGESSAASSGAHAASIPRNFVYAVVTTELATPNGLCFDVKGGSGTPGATLDVWSCNGTAAQRFTFWSDGTVTGPGGLCLDVRYADANAGVLDMTTCNGTPAQQWALRGQRVVGLANKCLTTSPFPNLNDVPRLAACDQGTDVWTPLDAPGPLVGIGGNCLDVLNGATTDGTPVQTFTCNGAPGQTFHFTSRNEIVSGAGKCLDLRYADANAGVVDMATCNGTAAQKWSLSGRQIRNFVGGGCLDALDGAPTANTTVHLSRCNGTQAQQWFASNDYSEGMATLLVVTDGAMASDAATLVAHKNATGMPAALVTVDQLTALICNGACPASIDPAALVKHGIDYFYRNRGTKYVFLAGDATHVPVRYITRYDQTSTGSWSGYYAPSDHYYANLYRHAAQSDLNGPFATWDNGDGIYNLSAYHTPASTWNPDNVDGYPDVAIGRLDVSQTSDLANYVAKVKRYETSLMAYAGNGAFVEDAVYDHDNCQLPGSFESTDGIANSFWPSSSSNKTFFANNYNDELQNGSWGPSNNNCSMTQSQFQLPFPWQAATPTSVVNSAITSGIVTYFGHSAQDGWDSPNSTGFEGLFTQTSQTNNFPLVFAAACLSGSFANSGSFSVFPSLLPTNPTPAQLPSQPPAPAIYNAFSNYLLAHATSGGAISYVGNMEVHEPTVDIDLLKLVAQRYAAGEKTLGDMWRQGQQDYWHANLGSSGYYYQTDSNEWEIREPRIYFGVMPLFGDPSLRMQRGRGVVR